MRIGIFVSDTGGERTGVEELRRRAQWVEEHGFASAWVPHIPWSLDGLTALVLAAQVTERIAKSERRAILLLGLFYGRRPLHRAATQLRSKSPRARSAAVELLEEHVIDPALRRIVKLVESTERTEVAGRPPADRCIDRWLDRSKKSAPCRSASLFAFAPSSLLSQSQR